VRLAQALGNLLDNAVKFSDDGGTIVLAVEPSDGSVDVRVQDSGIGIAPDVLPRIFELFTQADRTLARERGGLGIGLTVVRRLVELHGGTVRAASDGLGHGTEFRITLPILADADSLAEAATPARSVSGPARRVLVVDDNRDSAEGVRRILEREGHTVELAHDGSGALQAARQSQPEIVVLDLGLPGMDGYEVARVIRADANLTGTFLIAMTGYGTEADRQRALAVGFDVHLTKPIEPGVLRDLVRRAESG
jgi:CheY-like chemotaxis protein